MFLVSSFLHCTVLNENMFLVSSFPHCTVLNENMFLVSSFPHCTVLNENMFLVSSFPHCTVLNENMFLVSSFPRCTVSLKTSVRVFDSTATHFRHLPSLVSHDEYGHDPRVVLVVETFRHFLLPVHRHVVNRSRHPHHLVFPSCRRQDGRRRADIWQFLYHGFVEVIPKIDQLQINTGIIKYSHGEK